MAKSKKIAKRYAQAIFDLAVENKVLEQANDDFLNIRQACESSKELRLLLNNPVVHTKKKQAILQEIFKDNQTKEVQLFVDLLVKKNRETYIMDIAEEFVDLYHNHNHITEATVTTAVPLNEELRQRVLQLVGKQTNNKVRLIEKVNRNLIGGYTLLFEGKKYDASIKHKLEQIKKDFDKNPYLKGF